MADGITGKVKDFFGFGDVDSFDDPYYRDEFEEDRGGYRSSGRYQDREDDRDRDRDYERPDRTERAERAERPARSERSDYDYRAPRTPRRAETPVAPVAPVSPAQSREPQVVRLALSSFQQAGELATEFKAGDIVVLNLSAMEKSEASRVLDFSVGLAKGLDGTLKKLGGIRNFALIPASVTLDQSQLDQLVEDQ
ncbi:MAG: cell division protein SepF [Corynebacterium sp.]|uniref:cell division protein SepF n=1 Tax=unclassified Corynebacterium TaxID=2624378 RepID=UPI00264947FF|nr:cell division protein SepF [Corynebacterium sp.]MDN5581569.1 cell division protein SepF [Corynebacterium sp.]MDN5718887.1 cell division protein SepF [Corynebacterium sp.]MDN6259953.1 cell division protein SepF [Corynebacterium sp.]MDN6386245.1 cell division protein SepF [Corynebacterium sp.]MDN6510743.1 cell division protein SepF [Corynebacterium sp.]